MMEKMVDAEGIEPSTCRLRVEIATAIISNVHTGSRDIPRHFGAKCHDACDAWTALELRLFITAVSWSVSWCWYGFMLSTEV